MLLTHSRIRTRRSANGGIVTTPMTCSLTALSTVAVLAIGIVTANAKGGTAKPPTTPPPPAVGANCPTGSPATSACIVPPAGPVLPNFPTVAPALSGNPSNGFAISGHVQAVTGPACGTGSLLGGTVTVNGITITIPANTIVQYPANTLTWADAICGIAAIATNQSGGTAPAIYPGVEISVDGNIVGGTPASPHIGSIVHISQHSVNSGSGYISAINFATGSLTIATPAGPAGRRTVTLRLNDPRGRFGIAQSSADARFSVDDANPTIKAAASGYPMCIPRSAADPRCPQVNRPTAGCRNFAASGTGFRIAGADLNTTPINGFCTGFVMKALAGFPGTAALPGTSIAVAGVDPDPREMAPFEIGDFITWQGTLVSTGNPATDTIWVHTIDANVGIYTQPATLPAYIAIGQNGIGIDPESAVAAAIAGIEGTPRIFMEANTTDVASIVDIYLDDKGFSLGTAADQARAVRAGCAAGASGPCLIPDRSLITAPAAPNEYFRWITPESMTGTLADQAAVAAKAVVAVPASLVNQASAFGGGIYTQFIGPQPGRARIRAIKTPPIDLTASCPITSSAPTAGGSRGCAITQSPTRYIRAVLRSLCAPAASGAASATRNAVGTIVNALVNVPSTNLDDGNPPILNVPNPTSPNLGPYFDINLSRAILPGAAAVGVYDGGAGIGNVSRQGGNKCLESAQYANGLFTGQYMAPVGEFIFPENTLAGFAVLPSNFWHMGFLAYGENGRDGNATAQQAPRPW